MKEVWVVSGEWKFRALIRAQLRELGYVARGFERLDDAADELTAGQPALLVWDLGGADLAGVREALARWPSCVPVLAVLGAETRDYPWPANVTVLRRPLPIRDVVARVAEQAGAPD